MRFIAAIVFVTLVSSSAAAQMGGGGIGEPTDTAGSVSWSVPLLWQQSVTVNSFRRGAQLTHTPSYVWWLTALPSYAFNDRWSISGAFNMSYEWTDAAEEEFNRVGFNSRDLLIGDTRLSATYRLPQTPGDFSFAFRGDLRLPSSEFSRSRKRVISPGLAVLINRPFPVLQGMNLGLSGAYWGWFARSNVGTIRGEGFECRIAAGPGDSPGTSFDTCIGGATSVRHWTAATLSLSLRPLRKLGIATSYTTLWGRAFGLAEACVDTIGGQVCLGDQSANNHWRTFSGFDFGVSYDITPYLTGTFSYNTWSAHPDSDGSVENPIWNENTRLIFGLMFTIDQLYTDVKQRRARKARESAIASRRAP